MTRRHGKGILFAAAAGWLLLSSCGNSQAGLEASGTLEAIQVRIPAKTAGAAVDVFVREGDFVEPGDSLAQLEDEVLILQRDQARAARDMSASALDLVLQGARSEDLDQARDALATADENLRLVSDEADRLRALIDSGSISIQQLDRAESAETVAAAARSQAASALSKLERGAREPEIAGARAALDQAEAVLALAEKRLADTLISAPVAGTVLYRMLEPGEWAAPGFSVFVLADIRELRLTVYVPEPDLAKIRLGQDAEVRMDGTDAPVSGRVTWISPEAEFTPKNVQTRDERAKQVFAVRIQVENPDGVLKSGMPADAVFSPAAGG